LKDTLMSGSVPKSKISVFPGDSDSAVCCPRVRSQKDGRFIVFAPSSLQDCLGLDVGIRAFARVREIVPNTVFHLYLEGERQDLAVLADSLGLDGSVKFHTGVTSAEASEIMAEADVGLVSKRASSVRDGDEYSTKIKEFTSHGVAVIAAKTEGSAAPLDESAVHFFTSGDDREMAEALIDVIRNGQVRNDSFENGRKSVEGHRWDQKRKLYFDLVDSLLTEKFDAGKEREKLRDVERPGFSR
jgi:glycosyltransferase involved in cell wall biosynthesis